MVCPTYADLFEKFANATEELYKATDNLSMLTGQREAFAEAKKVADAKRLKSRTARQALEKHWKEHGCGSRTSE